MKHVFYVILMTVFSFLFALITCTVIDNSLIGVDFSTRIMITDSYLTIRFVSFFAGLIPAFIAKSKGRGFYKWWIYGYIICLIAIIHSVAINKHTSPVKNDDVNMYFGIE
jgi:glucan phosphoethanolaminetransferase (alkaline phosphatase superfamily)